MDSDQAKHNTGKKNRWASHPTYLLDPPQRGGWPLIAASLRVGVVVLAPEDAVPGLTLSANEVGHVFDHRQRRDLFMCAHVCVWRWGCCFR